MKGLGELLKEVLLNESVSVDDISSAIDNHSRIIINYESKVQDVASGARAIDVYAYGQTTVGNDVIRAFQPYGDTASKVPSWKLFRLDGITYWEETNQAFNEPAQGFNPNGDASMAVVYKIAKFDDETSNDGIFKTDTERGMERLRQQLNNPITIDRLKQQNANNVNTSKPAEPELKDDNEEDKVFKTDTERGMERLRQQLENPTKIDLDQFNKEPVTTNTDNNGELDQLRQELGDTSTRLTVNDLNQKLQNFNAKNQERAQDDVFKTDTERGMERLKQQLENPTKIDLSKFERKR